MTNTAPKHLDVAELIAALDMEGMQAYRDDLVEEIMDEQQRVSSAWSFIDGPFAQPHSIDDHDMMRDEFRALIMRSVVLPESVEGIRFLEKWYEARLGGIKTVLENCAAGNTISLRPERQPELHRDIRLDEDMARGMRLGLSIALSMFDKFPLALTLSSDSADLDNV